MALLDKKQRVHFFSMRVPRSPPHAPARQTTRLSRVFDEEGIALPSIEPRSLDDAFSAVMTSEAPSSNSKSSAVPLPAALKRLGELQAAVDTALVLASLRSGSRGGGIARAHALAALAPVVEATAKSALTTTSFLEMAAVAAHGGCCYVLRPANASSGSIFVEMAGCGHANAAVCSSCAPSIAGPEAWLLPRRASFAAAAQRIVHAAHGRFLSKCTSISYKDAVAESERYTEVHHGRLHDGFVLESVELPVALEAPVGTQTETPLTLTAPPPAALPAALASTASAPVPVPADLAGLPAALLAQVRAREAFTAANKLVKRSAEAAGLPAATSILLARPGSGAKLAAAVHAQFIAASRGALPLATLSASILRSWGSSVAEGDIDRALRALAERAGSPLTLVVISSGQAHVRYNARAPGALLQLQALVAACPSGA